MSTMILRTPPSRHVPATMLGVALATPTRDRPAKALRLGVASLLVALSAVLAPPSARADFVLDTGSPPAVTSLPYTLNSTNFYAAEFSLGANATITNVQAFMTAGMDSPGDTFTIALYAAQGFTGSYPTELDSAQATYTADGWTGLSNLSWTPGAAGQYWIALEVGANDSAIGLDLPTPASGGTVAAQALAYNNGSGYALGGPSIALEVTAVPLPAAIWLLAGGLGGLGALGRRRRRMPMSNF